MRRWLAHGCRTQKNDIAALVRPHDGNHQAGQSHSTHQQELIGLVPLIFAQVLDAAIGDVPRIDDEDIDSAKSFTDLSDKMLNRPTIGNVRPRREHAAGGFGTELRASSGQRLFAPTADGDNASGLDKPSRAGKTETFGRRSNKRDLAFKLEI